MRTRALHDFIVTVPTCVEATRLAVVLEIFSKGQCDRLVVVSEQQYPIGVVNLRRLMPQVMSSSEDVRGSSPSRSYLNVQQPLYGLGLGLVEPIVTIPAQLSVEQFGAYLRNQPDKTNTGVDWALVDSDGKFLGLVDSPRLLQYLAISPPWAMDTDERERDRVVGCVDSLVELLERLPWPVMLQTDAGEVVTQNPAWLQQFGALNEPEQVRLEVEAILETSCASEAVGRQQAEVKNQKIFAASSYPTLWSGLLYGNVSGESPKGTLPIYVEAPDINPLSAAASSSRCQLGNQPGSCICIFSGQNGQERVWQFVKIPLHVSVVSSQLDNEQIWVLLANDVTEEQQLASELAAKNADLIQLNRLKDEFLACISHELKTPLTAVLGLSSLLKDQALGQLNERQARYARLIHQSGRQLMIVVNDILDLTCMETGQLQLELMPVQIRSVCDRAIQQARAMEVETKQPSKAGAPLEERPCEHRFTLLIEPGLDSFVADELRLRQMLVHLLSNAFKFTETGGEIELRVSRWEGWIAFTVWDTGIGIPEHKQHLIFQKFQQLETPLTRQVEGTGLGLVLTRALARLHGGDISFLSKEGKGSQFTLLLPPSPPKAGFADGEASPHHPTSSKRLVLVVEAAPRFIEDLTEQLTSLGYQFVIARSGTEALEKARRLQPAAVFLNPLLPLLSGWDVLTLLKSDAATCHLPVIVTATGADKDQAFSNRADEFLSLPVQQQVLQQILARFCARISLYRPDGGGSQSARTDTALIILRLVTPYPSRLPGVETQGGYNPSLGLKHKGDLNYRILEADDLDQAELLARIWQPHVVLLERGIPDPVAYLEKLSQHPSLKSLPLVTLDAITTHEANQVTGLSVFPCLTSAQELGTEALLSVLKIAAGISWKPSLLVVNFATLPDLESDSSLLPGIETQAGSHSSCVAIGSEWFQALIQYLQTAGFKAVMARSWAEVLQQIRQQSVDLLLICLGDSTLAPGVLAALRALAGQHNVPPVLVLEQRLSQGEFGQQFHHYQEGLGASTPTPKDRVVGRFSPATAKSDAVESLETVLGAIATQILPPSLSMAELLSEINQTLAARRGCREEPHCSLCLGVSFSYFKH